MPMPVKVRLFYEADAGYLMVLVRSVEADPRQSPGWRDEIADHLRKAAGLMLEAKRGPIAKASKKSRQVSKAA